MKKISCIIAAYNEGPRIGDVLLAVVNHELIYEVIVIDDGSEDDTVEVVQSFTQVRLISQKNQGKSAAIAHGVEVSSGDFLLFIDADLCGLTRENVLELIYPVLHGEANAAISLRNYPLWRMIGIDPLGGERLLPRALITDALGYLVKLHSFGLEVFINSLLITHKVPIAIVSWKNVESPFKSSKYGFWAGLKKDYRMIGDIFSTISIRQLFLQIIELRRLRVRHTP